MWFDVTIDCGRKITRMLVAIKHLFQNVVVAVNKGGNDSAITSAEDATLIADFPNVHPMTLT